MGRRYSHWTLDLIKRRLAEGRGQGEGSNYTPWLLVQNFPSRGRVHRIMGCKTGRVHHLLSDLERNVFLHFQWPHSSKDQREQFPLLPLEETIEIAKEIGVRHPIDPITKCPIVMTTDLVLTIEAILTSTLHPFTVKYSNDLQNFRTREKLEIERRYWAASSRNAVLKIMTERQISLAFIKNMLWVLPYFWPTDLYPLTAHDINRIALMLTQLNLGEELPLQKLTHRCDQLLRLEIGTSLAVVRHLLAKRFWEVDMSMRIRTNERLILLNASELTQNRTLRFTA